MIIYRYKKVILFILLLIALAAFVWNCLYIYLSKTNEEKLTNKTKILLIGLDGATWNIIQPLLRQNKLPNMKRLIDRGSSGSLKSLYGYVASEIIWTTIVTGKIPYKHGIIDRLMKNPDTGDLIPVTRNLIKSKVLWDILSESDRTAGVVGYLVTWPPENIEKGLIISDRTWSVDYPAEGYTSPSLAQLCSQSDFGKFKDIKESISPHPDVLVAKRRDGFMASFANYLSSRQNFDFFTVYLLGIDRVSHKFWKYMEPEGYNIPEEEIKRYGNIIKDYYIYCDNIIGDLLNKIDKDTVVIVVSDHGFSKQWKELFFTGLNSLLERSGLSNIQRGSKTVIIHEDPGEDWIKKKYIRIEGDLSKEELNSIKDEAKSMLSQIRVEEDSRPFFVSFQDNNNGLIVQIDQEYINLYPSRHLIINNKIYKMSDFLSESPSSGNHDDFGIIIISGKHIHHGIINSASVYDITPTILYIMGLPVAKDMDGIVLTGAINSNFLRRNSIKYISTYETSTGKNDEKPILSPMDEELKKGMRSLGYIN